MTESTEAFLEELHRIEDMGTTLLRVVVLNYTGFEKILKKNYKATKSDMREKWFPRVNKAYFFTSRAIDDMLMHLHALRKVRSPFLFFFVTISSFSSSSRMLYIPRCLEPAEARPIRLGTCHPQAVRRSSPHGRSFSALQRTSSRIMQISCSSR